MLLDLQMPIDVHVANDAGELNLDNSHLGGPISLILVRTHLFEWITTRRCLHSTYEQKSTLSNNIVRWLMADLFSRHCVRLITNLTNERQLKNYELMWK